MVTASIVLLYISYAIPITFLLFSRGRSNIPHGPFWTGAFGLFSNIVLLAWTIFTVVMYSFPPAFPVNAGNMNYVCVVYGIVVFLLGADWLFRGRKSYRGQEGRREDAGRLERIERGVEVGSAGQPLDEKVVEAGVGMRP